MKKKLFAILLAAATAIVSTFYLAACNNGSGNDQSKWGNEYSYTAAYAQAQELGYTGTLEEFIATISGKDGTNGTNGKDGATPHIGDNGNWFIGETDTGVKAEGTNGKDGKDGVGIKNATVDIQGHLIITLTDDREIDCGEIRNIHKHEFGEWTTLMQSDCTKTGFKLRICETCGYTEANLIPTTEHDWSKWQNDKESNEHVRECSQCGATESAPHNVTGGVCSDCGTVFSIPEACVPVQGEIIAKFGYIKDVSLGGNWSYHSGLDIAADEGTSVVAVLSGTVESVVSDNALNGSYITIVHANGVKSKYQFIDVKTDLKAGDKIIQGNVIGTVGAASGKEYNLGAHLHFELYLNGEAVDPEQYIDFGNN